MRYDKLMSVSLPVLTPLLFASTAFAQDDAAAETAPPNAIAEAFANAGPIGWIIVVISVVSVALIIENFVSIKRDKLAPPDIINELEALFDEENFQEAMDLCEQEHMYLTNVVQAGLAKLGHPFEHDPDGRA